jgi:hypothetical protein
LDASGIFTFTRLLGKLENSSWDVLQKVAKTSIPKEGVDVETYHELELELERGEQRQHSK